MSVSAPSLAGLPASTGASAPSVGGLPAIDPATEPAVVRHGGKAAKDAYQTGLAFEQMLVSELTQTMSDTLDGADPSGSGSGSDASGGGSDAGGGSGSSPLGPYASLLPGALSSSIMSSGGTGVAMQIARSIDPQLNGPR
jgi:hypothetical protein